WWRNDRERFRLLLLLDIFSVAAVVSITYLPDFIHIAFIGPVLSTLVGELLQTLLAPLRRWPGLGRASRVAVSAVLLLALGWQLERNLARARREFPFVHDTPFGRVAFRTP